MLGMEGLEERVWFERVLRIFEGWGVFRVLK